MKHANTTNSNQTFSAPEKQRWAKMAANKKWIAVNDAPTSPPDCASNADCLKKFPQAVYFSIKLTCNTKSHKCEII